MTLEYATTLHAHDWRDEGDLWLLLAKVGHYDNGGWASIRIKNFTLPFTLVSVAEMAGQFLKYY